GAPWFRSYLGEVAAHQLLIASATSEIGTGGDIGRSVAAVEGGPDGLLTFEKRAPSVSYGAHCDGYLTTVRRRPGAAPRDQVMVLHRRDETELEPFGTWDTIGMRGTCSSGFVLRPRFTPQQVLAANAADVLIESMVPVSHVLWSFVWLGIASDAFERGRAYWREAARRQAGDPPAAVQRLAQVMSRLSMLRDGAHAGLNDLVTIPERPATHGLGTMGSVLRFNNLKLAASEQAPRICADMLSVIGAEAYRNDSRFALGRHLRDALSAQLMVANGRILEADASLLLITKSL
ncbi:MAG: acyl-CoA dehydrogenase, partial [Solirubrobacterales bacterium]|nr:acyl-CoA dehydrogenase [Solirubrobacterales bacterium]